MGMSQCSSKTVVNLLMIITRLCVYMFFFECFSVQCMLYMPMCLCECWTLVCFKKSLITDKRSRQLQRSIPGWRWRRQGDRVLQMQNEFVQAGFLSILCLLPCERMRIGICEKKIAQVACTLHGHLYSNKISFPSLFKIRSYSNFFLLEILGPQMSILGNL